MTEANLPWLNYEGQSIEDLLRSTTTHRTDSIVCAIETALLSNPREPRTRGEFVVLAIEAMEREVNNGGFEQFFTNDSKEHTSRLVQSLVDAGCPRTAEVAADAIALLGLPPSYTPDDVERAASDLPKNARRRLSACDERYLQTGEDIATRLLDHVKRHAAEIRVP